MDAARQVLRWSIPGTLFLLLLLGSQSVMGFAWGERVLDVETPTIVLLAASSIPIGFLLQSIYYVAYQPVRFRWLRKVPVLRSVVADDRGGRILWGLVRPFAGTREERRAPIKQLARRFGLVEWGVEAGIEGADTDGVAANRHGRYGYSYKYRYVDQHGAPQITTRRFAIKDLDNWVGKVFSVFQLLELVPLFSEDEQTNLTRKQRRARLKEALQVYVRVCRQNWAFVNALVADLNNSDPNGRIRSEFESSLDVYHALGIVRTSCWLGWLGTLAISVVGYHEVIRDNILATTVAFSGVTLAFVVIASLFHLNRRDALISLENFMKLSLFYAVFGSPNAEARGMGLATELLVFDLQAAENAEAQDLEPTPQIEP